MATAETLWIVYRYLGQQPQPDDLDLMCATTGTESPVSLRWVVAHL